MLSLVLTFTAGIIVGTLLGMVLAFFLLYKMAKYRARKAMEMAGIDGADAKEPISEGIVAVLDRGNGQREIVRGGTLG